MIGPSGKGSSSAHLRTIFESSLAFGLDDFQRHAFDAVEAKANVMVSAPTGSGKTLVGAYAIERALHEGRKSFYTTPLKALSNQKYAELVQEHGELQVGLLTGDTAIRASAPIVVMTTEVLRNMLMTGSSLLEDLGVVVLDEVHFIQDPYRGGVWEEVLILTPPDVQFVCLSATVANASVLGSWIESVRGPTTVIVERKRPIRLHNHVAVVPRGESHPRLLDLLNKDRVSDEGLRIDQSYGRQQRSRGSWEHGRRHGPPRPYGTPRRFELLESLEDREMLPAIFFIFSRAQCDEAVRQLLRDGLRFVKKGERLQIRAIAEHYVEEFDDDELVALGYPQWLEGLESGIGAHHAGMVPAFRECVEYCFAQGLLSVVFATETLSLGINMPARTVVLERFSKFGGAGRSSLTSGEYAQLTGRAGRRGLDDEGHAVVCFTPEISISDIARVAMAPPPDLHSSFRPTYNLTCNLVHRFTKEASFALLAKSYAQFEVDHHHHQRRRSVAEVFSRRITVLEELGYLDGWKLTEQGNRLREVYHETDLLLTESIAFGAFDDIDAEILAGVLSAYIFEPRRARHVPGPHRSKNAKKRGALPDRLGQGRRQQLRERLSLIARRADLVHEVEERHSVTLSRSIEPGLATAVASWARGASLSVVLEVAQVDVGEIAPGDFVRVVRQVADLADQIAETSSDSALAAVARDLTPSLLRSVVASGGPVASASPRPTPF